MWAGVCEVSTRPNPPFNLTPASLRPVRLASAGAG